MFYCSIVIYLWKYFKKKFTSENFWNFFENFFEIFFENFLNFFYKNYFITSENISTFITSENISTFITSENISTFFQNFQNLKFQLEIKIWFYCSIVLLLLGVEVTPGQIFQESCRMQLQIEWKWSRVMKPPGNGSKSPLKIETFITSENISTLLALENILKFQLRKKSDSIVLLFYCYCGGPPWWPPY